MNLCTYIDKLQDQGIALKKLTCRGHNPAGPERAAAAASAARVVINIAQMTEYIRGSRVEDYAPLFALTTRLGSVVAAHPAADESVLSQSGVGDESAGSHPHSVVSLPGAALRLVAAVIGGHGKDVGASAGLSAISRAAPGWAPLLTHAPIDEVIFLSQLLCCACVLQPVSCAGAHSALELCCTAVTSQQLPHCYNRDNKSLVTLLHGCNCIVFMCLSQHSLFYSPGWRGPV